MSLTPFTRSIARTLQRPSIGHAGAGLINAPHSRLLGIQEKLHTLQIADPAQALRGRSLSPLVTTQFQTRLSSKHLLGQGLVDLGNPHIFRTDQTSNRTFSIPVIAACIALPIIMISLSYFLLTADSSQIFAMFKDLDFQDLIKPMQAFGSLTALGVAAAKSKARRTGSSLRLEEGRRLLNVQAAVRESCDYNVRLVSNGIVIDGNTMPYAIFVADTLAEWRENIGKQAKRDQQLMKMYEMIGNKRREDYETQLKFLILVFVHDIEADTELVGIKHWNRDHLIRVVNTHFARVFASPPDLPIEHGIWTELVEAKKAYEGRSLNIASYVRLVHRFLRTDKPIEGVKRCVASIKLGPIEYSFADILEIYSKYCNVRLRSRKPIRGASARNRRAAVAQKIKERAILGRTQKWLKRSDIPEATKQHLAVIFIASTHAGAEEVTRLFASDDFAMAVPEHAKEIIDRMHDEHITMKLKVATGHARVVNANPQEWNIVPMDVFFPLIESELPDSNRSYTLFRLSRHYEVFFCLQFRSHLNPGLQERLGQEAVFDAIEALVAYIRSGDKDQFTSSLIMDLIYQVGIKSEAVYIEVHKILKQRERGVSHVRMQMRSLYKRYFPYADALFAQLKKEDRAANTPEKVAERTIAFLRESQLEIGLAFQKIITQLPKKSRSQFIKLMTAAFASINSNSEIFKHWINALSSLHGDDAWSWINDYNDSEPASVTAFVRRLQDMSYPIGDKGQELPHVLAPSRLSRLSPDEWHALRREASFLTPDEFNALNVYLSELVGFGESGVIAPAQLKIALRGLTLLLQNRYGQLATMTMRRLLREGLTQSSLLSILKLSHATAITDNPREVQTAIGHARSILEMPTIQGNPLSIANRLAFGKYEERQGAMAELLALQVFHSARLGVTILDPDIHWQRKTPDLKLVLPDTGVECPVEVKSRTWIPSKFDVRDFRRAIHEAAEQVAALRQRRELLGPGYVLFFLLDRKGVGHPEIRSAAEELLRGPRGQGLGDQIGVINISVANPATSPWQIFSSETVSAH